jgi:hypothetical protein
VGRPAVIIVGVIIPVMPIVPEAESYAEGKAWAVPGVVIPRIVVPRVVEAAVVGIMIEAVEVTAIPIRTVVVIPVIIIFIVIIVARDDDAIPVFTLVRFYLYVVRLVVIIPVGAGELGIAPGSGKQQHPEHEPAWGPVDEVIHNSGGTNETFHGSTSWGSKTRPA